MNRLILNSIFRFIFLIINIFKYPNRENKKIDTCIVFKYGGLGDNLLLLPTLIYLKENYKKTIFITRKSSAPSIIKELITQMNIKIIFLEDMRSHINILSNFLKILDYRIYYFEQYWSIFLPMFFKSSSTVCFNSVLPKYIPFKRNINRISYEPYLSEDKMFFKMASSNKDNIGNSENSNFNNFDSKVKAEVIKITTKIFHNYIFNSNLNEIIKSDSKKLFLFYPGCSKSNTNRRWPAEKYSQLIKYLLAEYSDSLILLLGSSSDLDVCNEIYKIINSSNKQPQLRNLCCKTSLYDIAKLCSLNSSFFIGNDGGLLHIFRTFSLNKNKHGLILVGPSNIPKWIPHSQGYYSLSNQENYECSPCLIQHKGQTRVKCKYKDFPCISTIEPREAFDLITSKLN